MIYSNTIITKKGRALIAKLQDNGGNTSLKYLATGAGAAQLTDESVQLTDQKQVFMLDKTSISEENPTKITIQVTANNEGLEEAYNIRELGIFAEDPDEGMILYAAINTNETAAEYDRMPAYMTESDFKEIIFNIQLEVADVGSVAFELSPEALRQQVQENTIAIENLKKKQASGLPPDNMVKFKAVGGNSKATVYIEGPGDTIVDGQLICTVQGVKVLRKEGGFPENEEDGITLLDLAREEFALYTSQGYVDENLTNGTTYYYAAFPYSDHGVVNRNENNRTSARPETTLVFGFREVFGTLDPEQRIEYIEANENYTQFSMNADGTQNLGSWDGFDLLEKNLPYMVKANGEADYQLDPNDYTKKLDGTASDISNASYEGGAFSWLEKIYSKETYAEDGSYREVRYAFKTDTEATADFEPVGFEWDDQTVLEGLWIPMFYMDANGKTIAGTQPVYGKTTDEERTLVRKMSARALHLGGPVMNLLRDLMYMFCKSTDIQTHLGNGCMSAYDSSASPTYGVKKNAVVGGGQFYGTSDGKSLNKAFHSIALQSYQQYLRDPMTILSAGKLLVSKYYSIYSLTAAGYMDTGITFAATGSRYAAKLVPTDGFGSVHSDDNSGSTSTGSCDYQYYNITDVRIARRLGDCYNGLDGGPGYLDLSDLASNTNWSYGVGQLLCPSAGYSPE